MTGLRRFLDRTAPVPVPERCELCATPVPGEHPHLVHVTERRLRCACGPCAFLFDNPGAGAGEYRRVPDRWLRDPSATGVDALDVPVGVVFLMRSSASGRMLACYPGPAGATESELPPTAWESGPGRGPLADELADDVEALLVRRDPPTSLLVPIDACYRLAGIARRTWHGFDGGTEARDAIEAFFADALARATVLPLERQP
ncbi:DUF5947 family protein [Pseudonocardia nematodicida]|uniref:DUF5947 family protein n=1 Tax=Pseudonocardia nematodicida TaxID=1206997 RepID=A0ABV1K6F0_9PSEU